MLMPVGLAMKSRTSLTWAFGNWTRSGSRDAGLSTGSGDAARACARSASMAGRGRDASMRSRIVCSSSVTLAPHGAVARVVLRGQPVLAERGLELVPLLELLRALEMGPRRGHHRALQRDRVVRIVGIGLDGPAVRGDGFVEIARAHGVLALP